MPIDLAGISNENEFYTEHYLSTILDGDLRDTLSRWRRQAEEAGTHHSRHCVVSPVNFSVSMALHYERAQWRNV